MHKPEVYLVIFSLVGVPIAGLLIGVGIAKRQGFKKIWLLGVAGALLSHVLWILSFFPMTFVVAMIFLTASDLSAKFDLITWFGFLIFIVGSIAISLMLTNMVIKRIALFVVNKSTAKE